MKPPRNERESHAELVARITRESDAALRMVGRPRVPRKRRPILDEFVSTMAGVILGGAVAAAVFQAMTRGA